MTRTFIYSFTPPSIDPAPGATIELDVSESEDAGIREVLQTPGAAHGRSWTRCWRRPAWAHPSSSDSRLAKRAK
jgi:hypothetical protein